MSYVSIEQKRRKIKNILTIAGITMIVAVALIVGIKVLRDKGFFNKEPAEPTKKPEYTATPVNNQTPEPEETPEPWDYVNESGTTIITRFNPPKGYTRVSLPADSFGEYLRNYPLKPVGSPAYFYDESTDGLVVKEDVSNLGVFVQQDELTRWQQCADSAIMLYAEYLYSQARYDEISFHFLNGFVCDYPHWVAGNRVNVSGNNVTWVDKTSSANVKPGDYSYPTFLKYLNQVYQYANTSSLGAYMKNVKEADMYPGCIINATSANLKAAAKEISEELADSIQYGHAIMVVDMAVNDEGEMVFMIAEGNTPSTEVAVVENPDPEMGVWFKFDENGKFVKTSSGVKWSNGWIYTFAK